ncbi:MAG: hypothetical protein BZY75_02950 [SAR202 cluster bacterium Io17-Chloro-G7]|nr:MAG: hypothetical protein BZY75_02950 [SAR202 cluster bacterium Io17-Chloro-G7]
MSFEKFSLHPQVLAGVKSAGYIKPTPIQAQAIPGALGGRDVLGLAQTGTGKTAAFALPILHRLASATPKRGIRALVIAPTRELAEQIHQTFVDLGKHLRVKSIAIYGGVGKGPQLAGVRRGPQVMVACPGRLLDHVDQKDIDLSNVEVLVLDEADTMCDMGFLPDVRRILAHIPAERQTLFFSATMPKEIRSLAVGILKDPMQVQIGAIAPAKTVFHALYPVPETLKKSLLLALLEQTATGRALVFTRTKHRARTLALDLAKKSYRVAALQGNMSQNARQRAMDGFRDGKIDILVATDIAAHGIDVPDVSHVINFDFPGTSDAYTHRIGRTGRAEQTGEAFTLAGAADGALIREVEKEIGTRIERRRLPGFDYGNFSPEEQFPDERPRVGGAGRPNNTGSQSGASTPGETGRPSSNGRPSSTGSPVGAGRSGGRGRPNSISRPGGSGGPSGASRPSGTGRLGEIPRPGGIGRPNSTGRPGEIGGPSSNGRPGGTARPNSTVSQSGANRSSSTSKPSGTGRPGEIGRPSGTGRPNSAGRPSNTGRLGEIGRPGGTGRPNGTGRPGDTNRPGSAGRPGQSADANRERKRQDSGGNGPSFLGKRTVKRKTSSRFTGR